jgi:hypothetical protein
MVQIQEFRNFLTRLAVIQQQKRIRPPWNAVVLALTMHASFQFAALCEGKEAGMHPDRPHE